MPDACPILSALWRASWQAGVLCLLVLASRWTLRDRLPPAWRCRLWGLVFLRLLLPAVPSSPLSLFNVVPADPLPAVQWPTVVVRSVVTVPSTVTPPAVEASPPAATPPLLPTAVLAGWLCVAAALATGSVVTHVRFARRVRLGGGPTPPDLSALWHAVGGGRPVVVTDAVTSPALFGVLRGRLLLPPDLAGRLSTDELTLVFRHESAHVRRHDLAAGWATVGVRCLYWFHPLVWMATAARRADAEAACDDAVVAATGDGPGYGRTLLAVAAGGRPVPAVGMADARTDLRRRLARVAAGRRPGWRSTVVAAALTVAVGSAALTGCNRPANVTRTYPNFWPADSGNAGVPGVHGSGQTTDTSLATTVRRSVTPDAWDHHGTAIVVDGTSVHVTAPPQVQARIERLIADGSVEVTVETRLLTLRPSQLRAAGLDLPDAGVVEPVPADRVAALIRTVAGDAAAKSLTPPRLTLFNGQRADLIVQTEQAYVSGLTPVVAPGAALFDPTVSTVVASGVHEWVRAAVTADRRAIDLTVRVELRQLLSLDPIEMTARVGSQTIAGTLQVPHGQLTAVDASFRLASGGSAVVRGTTADTYVQQGHPTTVPTKPTGDADAAVTVVVWTATVLPIRPATAAVPPAAGDPSSRSHTAGRPRLTPAMAPALANLVAPPSGLYGPVARILAASPATAIPTPGTPTPDGRGVAVTIPADVRNAVVFVDGDHDGTVGRLVAERGGQPADAVDMGTDYVVTATAPGDPDVRVRAKDLHIPVLNADLSPRRLVTARP